MSDLNGLVLFARVVEAGSLSEAARRARLPLSTVSRRLADFEQALGLRLIERSTRALHLTPKGVALHALARQGLDLSEAFDHALADQRDDLGGLVRLSTPPSLAETLLVPALEQFQKRHPRIDVQIFVTERHVEMISEGIDLALRLGPLRDSALIARPLLTYRHRLVASPDYLAGNGAPIAPKDLGDHRLIAFGYWSRDLRWTFVHGAARTAIQVRPKVVINDFRAVAMLIANGAGIGEVPPIVAPDLFRAGRLVEVMAPWRMPEHDLMIVHVGGRHVTPPVRLFIDHLAATLTEQGRDHWDEIAGAGP